MTHRAVEVGALTFGMPACSASADRLALTVTVHGGDAAKRAEALRRVVYVAHAMEPELVAVVEGDAVVFADPRSRAARAAGRGLVYLARQAVTSPHVREAADPPRHAPIAWEAVFELGPAD